MDRTDRSAESLLFIMGGAMFAVTVAVCVLIALPTGIWLGVAYGSLLVAVVLVGMYLLRLIDSDH
jgi:hypothetical protein